MNYLRKAFERPSHLISSLSNVSRKPIGKKCPNNRIYKPTYLLSSPLDSPNSNFHSTAFKSSNNDVNRKSRVRRRKRGGFPDNVSYSDSEPPTESGSDSSSRPIAAVKHRASFIAATDAFLLRVENALKPMKPYNDVFDIQLVRNDQGPTLTLALKPGDGMYTIQTDADLFTMTLNSPMSGSYTYVLCGRTGQFVGMDDGHLLEGMLVRDLIRHCNGLPDF